MQSITEYLGLAGGVSLVGLGIWQLLTHQPNYTATLSAGAGILVAASHSSKWFGLISAKAPAIATTAQTVVSDAQKLEPLLAELAPAQQARLHLYLGNTAAALAATEVALAQAAKVNASVSLPAPVHPSTP